MARSRIIPQRRALGSRDGWWRPLGCLSLGLNLALVGWWGFTSRPAARLPHESRPSPPRTIARTARSGPDVRDAPAATDTTTNTLPFRWSMLESDDYRVYIANLRGGRCPEPILRDMIVAELQALYRRRNRDLPEPAFWTAGAARAQAGRDRRKAEQALEAEKRAVYHELLGVDWPCEEHEGAESLALSDLFLAFLSEERRSHLTTSIRDRDAAADAIRDAANGILLRSDRAQLQALYDRWAAEISAQFGPAELTEIRLRIGIMGGHDLDEEHFEGLALTGREFREFVRIRQAGKDLLREEFLDRNGLREPGDGGRASALDADQRAGLRDLLGDERLAAYERNRDPQYREARNFVQEHKLPPTTAVQLYEVRRAMDAAAAELRVEASLSAEERVARLEAMAVDANDAIGRILGPAAAQAGAEQIQRWLVPLQKVTR